jgi:DNA replication ATP-dependent helicase Dna2
LFSLLSEAHPEAQVMLKHQYRMNRDIMTLSNRIIYKNLMRCGSEEVAEWMLELTDPKGLDKFHATFNKEGSVDVCEQSCWIRDVIAPE